MDNTTETKFEAIQAKRAVVWLRIVLGALGGLVLLIAGAMLNDFYQRQHNIEDKLDRLQRLAETCELKNQHLTQSVKRIEEYVSSPNRRNPMPRDEQ